MKTEEAIKVLHDYNKWRGDNHVPNKYPMPSPEKIGEAIDCAIHHLLMSVQARRTAEAHMDMVSRSVLSSFENVGKD